MSLFKNVADIQTADMLKLPVPEAHYHNIALKPSEYQKQIVASLAERAEKVRNREVDSRVDNMLLITNDGRKLALDQRLVNPMLPSDPDSKAAKCAENVFEIWQRTADQRSTQMIFCDLSTPGKERPIEMVQKEDGSFGMAPFQNVYEDIRTKLIELGVPENEIAFIHNAKSEVQKKDLFGKVRNGQVRILLGSTQRMGAGTNCQQKLVALHHLDCPWRPSDLQQREGRIIRQGNENKEVDIYSYVTEGTFDAYLYQLVESKQKFISQIMTSKSPVRSAEDVDEQALSYAEIKALASGNPLIKEKMDLDIEVSKLKLLKSNHLSQRYALEDAISKTFPKNIAEARERISGYEADIVAVKENTHPNADGFSPLTLMGVTYAEKKEAGAALLTMCQNMAEILKMLEPKLEVKTEDGYEGILSLDHTTIQVEAAGYSTSSRTVTAERTYPNLSDADVSLIPKTVNENGRTLTLADVSWEEAATDPTDGYDIPIRYTAMASYSGTATSKYATGYTVTADYKGDVTRTSCDTVIYTAIFSSTGRAEVLPKTGSFNWMWVLAPLGVLALGGCGYAGYKGYKHYLNKKRGYE